MASRQNLAANFAARFCLCLRSICPFYIFYCSGSSYFSLLFRHIFFLVAFDMPEISKTHYFFCGFFHIQIKCRIRTKQKGLADVVCRPWNLDFFKYQEIFFKFISSNKPDCSVFHHKHMARDIFPANLKVTDCEIIVIPFEGCI